MTANEQNVSPAQELRAAASKIRDAKHWAMPGPWCAYTDEVTTDWHPDSPEWREVRRDLDVARDTGPGNAAHIALWNPIVAEVVADWLDTEAKAWDATVVAFPGLDPNPEDLLRWPLRMARAINGGAQ